MSLLCARRLSQPNDVLLSVEVPQLLDIDWRGSRISLQRKRQKAAGMQCGDHGLRREAAPLTERRRIFEDRRVGARQRRARAGDHCRLVALDVNLKNCNAAVAKA